MPSQGRGDAIRAGAALAAAAALLIGLGVLAAHAFAARGIDITAVTQDDVERFVQAWGAWSALGSVALMVLHSFVPLPAEIIPLVNGMMFGPWLGIALTWIGAMLGAVLSFALARGLGRPFVRLVVSEARWRQVEAVPLAPGTLLLVRLVPLISFNLVNYGAGLLGVGWWTFLWTTAIGILPLTVAMVLVGGQILAAPLWAWALAAATVAALCVFWSRRAV